jgi:hypothetical protein
MKKWTTGMSILKMVSHSQYGQAAGPSVLKKKSTTARGRTETGATVDLYNIIKK